MTLHAAMTHMKLLDVPWLSSCGARRRARVDPSPLVDSDESDAMVEEPPRPSAARGQPQPGGAAGEGERRGRRAVQPEKMRKWTAQMEHVVFWVFEHLVIPVRATAAAGCPLPCRRCPSAAARGMRCLSARSVPRAAHRTAAVRSAARFYAARRRLLARRWSARTST